MGLMFDESELKENIVRARWNKSSLTAVCFQFSASCKSDDGRDNKKDLPRAERWSDRSPYDRSYDVTLV